MLQDAINQVFGQKQKAFLQQNDIEESERYPHQVAYELAPSDVERLYRAKENFIIYYRPPRQTVLHALKILDTDGSDVVAEHLRGDASGVAIVKQNVRDLLLERKNIKDLSPENKIIVVLMDDEPTKLTEEELASMSMSLSDLLLLAPEMPDIEPEFKSTVCMDLFLEVSNAVIRTKSGESGTLVAYEVKLEELRKFSNRLPSDRIVIVYKSKLGDFFHFLLGLRQLDGTFAYGGGKWERKVPFSYLSDDSGYVILITTRRIKEMCFGQHKELPLENTKKITMVYQYK